MKTRKCLNADTFEVCILNAILNLTSNKIFMLKIFQILDFGQYQVSQYARTGTIIILTNEFLNIYAMHRYMVRFRYPASL